MNILIDAYEANSIRKIKEDEKRIINKFNSIYQILLKNKREIQTLKAEMESLVKGDKFKYLERASKLQKVSTKPDYVPKVEQDHKLITHTQKRLLSICYK